MAINLRCTCGLAFSVGDTAPPACRVCPACGGRLALSFQSSSAAEAVETVPIAPTYESEAPPSTSWAYRAVPLPCADVEPAVSLPPPVEKPATPVDIWADASHRRNESQEHEVERLIAKVKHDWRVRNPRERWPLEENGLECLAFPLRVLRGIMTLAPLWATITLLVALALPTPESGLAVGWFALPYAIFPLALIGVTWNFLRHVLHAGIEGSREFAFSWVWDVRDLAESVLMAVIAFLAGPIFLVAALVWFWVNAGTLAVIDYLILWQLGICACVGWVYLLLALDARRRLRDAHAGAVTRLVRRQGRPGWVFPVVGGVSLAVFLFLLIQCWLAMPERRATVWVAHIFLWLVALFFWTALLRWYGLAQYWRREGTTPRRRDLSLRPFDAAWNA